MWILIDTGVGTTHNARLNPVWGAAGLVSGPVGSMISAAQRFDTGLIGREPGQKS
jgi:hypothetical protein